MFVFVELPGLPSQRECAVFGGPGNLTGVIAILPLNDIDRLHGINTRSFESMSIACQLIPSDPIGGCRVVAHTGHTDLARVSAIDFGERYGFSFPRFRRQSREHAPSRALQGPPGGLRYRSDPERANARRGRELERHAV